MFPLLKVCNISKKFKNNWVLKDISFELYPEEILGIIGPNGAGKTTLLYILLDLITPSSGTIFYFGKNLHKNRSEVLKKVNFASQYLGLPYTLTVEENLKFFACLYEIKNKKEKIEKLLFLFKLNDKKKVQTRNLSSGEMMRLNLARAFLNEPLVVLLDEPTAGLDPEYIKFIGEFLKIYTKEKKAGVILTSHQLGELEKLAEKLLLIKKGKCLACGKTSELLKNYAVNSLEELYFKIFKESLSKTY